MHAKHSTRRSISGACPRQFSKITPSEIKPEGIFSDFSLVMFMWAQVHTTLQNSLYLAI